MAVEIPVVIDIEGAFDEAAKRVSSAMQPLKQAIDENTAKIKLKIGEEWDDVSQRLVPIKKSLEDIVGLTAKFNQKTGKTTYSLTANIEELSVALEDAKKQYADLSTLEEKGLRIDYQKLDSYREAITVLQSEISLRQRNVAMVEKATMEEIRKVAAIDEGNYALIREAKTVTEISDKISALRGKIENIDPESEEWKDTANEIKVATAQLEKYKKALDKILAPATNRPPLVGSIDRISFEMDKLEKKWNAMSKKVKFDADGKLSKKAQKLVEDYKKLTEEAEKYGFTLKSTVSEGTVQLQKQHSVLSDLGRTFGAYISIHSLIRFARGVRDVTGELEYQRVALGRLLDDVSYGNYLFDRIKQAAIESPFRIKDLVTYVKQLAAYRIAQEDLFDTSKRLADISAGLGVEMNRLILAYGQVRAASVLRGQELRQFTEAGIPIVELLAEKFTDLRGEMVKTGDVFKLISERAVPFSMISDIFVDLTEKGGAFYKMQEEQAKTLKGRWEKLKDAYDIALQSVGDTTTFQNINDIVLESLTRLAGSLRNIVKVVDGASLAFVAYNAVTLLTAKRVKAVATAEQSAAIAEALRSKNVSGLIIKLIGQARAEYALTAAMTQATIGTTALTRALGRLKVALLTNPWAVAGAAILGVVMALTQFKKASDDTTDAINALNKSADELHTEIKRQERIGSLIELYEKLTSEENRNAAQNETLARTIKKLSDEFPQFRERLNDSNLPLAERLKLIKDLNKEEAKRLQMMKEQKERQLKAKETQLSYATVDFDAAQQAYDDATIYYNFLQERLEELASSGKKGRSAIAKFFLGSNEYDYVYDALVRQRQALDKAESSYNKAEEAVNGLTSASERLRTELYGSKNDGDEALTSWKEQLEKFRTYKGVELFTPEQLDSWHRLYDVSNDLEKEWKKLKEDIDGLQAGLENARNEGSDTVEEWEKDLAAANDKFKGYEIIREFFKFVWGKKEKTPKDTRLQDLNKDIREITNAYKKFIELRKYMGKDQALIEIDKLFPQLQGWEPTLKKTIDRLEDKLNDVKKKLAKSPKDNVLLDMQRALETEISNLRFDDLKRMVEDGVKKVSDELKRSEEARNFFKNIIDLTGDEDLAANLTVSVYGDAGEEFKDRISKVLTEAFESFDTDDYDLWDKMRIAIEKQDWNFILKNVEKFGDKWQGMVKQVASDTEKYNADIAKSFAELVSKYGSTQQKIDTITDKATNEINKVKEARDKALKESGVTPEQSKKINDRADEVIKALEAQRDLDIFKASDDYIKFFAELNVMTADQAALVRTKLRDAYFKAFHGGAINADELSKNLRAIDTQFRKLTKSSSLLESYLDGGFDKANEKLQEYADNVAVLAQKMKSGKELSADEQNFATKMLSQFGSGSTANIESYQQLIQAFSGEGGGLEAAGEAFGQMGEGMSAMAANGPGALAIVDAIFKAVHATISGIQQIIDQLNEVRSEENKIGEWFKYISDFDRYTFSGWEKLKSGDAIGATVDAISSWISIFTNVQKDKVKKFNDQIKEQGTLLEDLEYEYSRLGVAIEKSFGSDYIANYNQQISVLRAQAEAYRKQAELERKKGKSADEDTAKGYENSAREIEDQITDMQNQLSEFFTGTDVTSAAKDFAQAWIDAYQEFGSTTDAMKEKFNDMVENMVVNSLAAQLIQGILKPIFDQIDTAAKDGALTAEEIASISALVPDAMAQIDAGMTGLMNQLTAAGVNLRQQAGSFTGISRDIASASEESITGLAAGINTQNFYIQHIDQNVALILSVLTGGSTTAQASVTGQVADPYKDQMLQYAALMPDMHDDIHNIYLLLNGVIRARGEQTTKVVHTNL